MNIVELIKTRSTCLRREVGAVIVKDKRIIATGYNGAPKGTAHCEKTGCMREALGIPSGQRHELCRASHAEQNAIVQAAAYGVPIAGSTIYVTTQPCVICSKLIINSGIKRVVFRGSYPDKLSLELLGEAGIELVRVDEDNKQISLVDVDNFTESRQHNGDL
ncbi:MAG: cytidine deaminase [Clostridiales bacterium]|jgi:dCMP deaminase|nr:cytidine deaminase [Clostridiales bacterium]